MALFEKEYINDPALSQSDLKNFENDLNAFYQYKILGIEKENKTSKAMDIGNIIDAKLLAPEELNNYYVCTDFKAKGKVKDVVDLFVKKLMALSTGPEIVYPEFTEAALYASGTIQLLVDAIVELEFQGAWTPARRLAEIIGGIDSKKEKVVGKGIEYYTQVLEANGKYIVHLSEWNKAHEKVNAVGEDPTTKDFFDALFNPKDENIQVMRQVELRGVFEDKAMKGKLDLFLKNDVEKWIDPWDVKSARSHQQFRTNYRKDRLGRQGCYYTELLIQNYPGYTIKPFKFLVIPTQTEEKPEQYEMSAGEMYINAEGLNTDSGYRIKGWKELIREIQWHEKHGKWNHRKEYYLSGKNILDSKINVDDLIAEAEQQANVPLL